jgi:molecular chaperone DnaK
VDEQSKGEIEAAVKTLNESLTSEDAEEIRAKTDALNQTFHRISAAMYERAQADQAAQQQSENGSGNGSSASSEDDEVVDAEVVDES